MKKFTLLAGLALCFCIAAHADTFPVAGSTDGSFSGTAALGTLSGATWSWANGANASSLVYGSGGGTGFLGDTPLDINLGSLTLTNGGNGGAGAGNYSATLDLTVTFTTPVGSVVLSDPLTLKLVNGAKGYDLVLTSLPSQSFTVGGVTYLVKLDGLYDAASGGAHLTSLFVANPGGQDHPDFTSGTAYLRGTVIAAAGETIPTSTPEPGSFTLLFTALGGIAFSVRRKLGRRS